MGQNDFIDANKAPADYFQDVKNGLPILPPSFSDLFKHAEGQGFKLKNIPSIELFKFVLAENKPEPVDDSAKPQEVSGALEESMVKEPTSAAKEYEAALKWLDEFCGDLWRN